MLPKEAIEEFKRIYERIFKERLTYEEASRRANDLLNLYRAIYNDTFDNPLTKQHKNECKNRNKNNLINSPNHYERG